MSAYYNEHDKFAAEWLRQLIKDGHIAPGEVDERSVEDVHPTDLRGFTQCHFFAGIGVWSYALRRAGWPDDRPVWTGSCPCQPFSAAGKRGGVADERHLWPTYYHLISECKPRCIFGEQVSSKDGLTWFDTVQADLEASGYIATGLDLCAAGFGAPHIRQRLYFVAHTEHPIGRTECQADGDPYRRDGSGRSGHVGDLADSDGRNSSPEGLQRGGEHGQFTEDGGVSGSVVHPESEQVGISGRTRQSRGSGYWAECDWLPCIDGKSRPVEPGTFPLAHGIANRVGRLRGYGNALVAPVAQGFIEAYLETQHS